MNSNSDSKAPKLPPSQTQQFSVGGSVNQSGQGNALDLSQKNIQQNIEHLIVNPEAEDPQQALNTTSPYKGLKKFETNDHSLFFGREQFVESLCKTLEHRNFLLLLGASGSGKSSVVQAGLIPALHRQWGKRFSSLIFRPDEDPFEGFYASLVQRGYELSQVKQARQAHPHTLIRTINTLKPAQDYWLIVIDQFEQLFTRTPKKIRDQFIAGLVKLYAALTKAHWTRLKVVIAMRADFLEHLSPSPSFGTLAGRSIHLMTDMSRPELENAIAKPAEKHGVRYEEGLIEDIINTLDRQPGELPLLQYTLDLLWTQQNLGDRLLTFETYRAIGGVKGALEQHVNEIYNNLTPDEQAATKQIFLRLVDFSSSPTTSGSDKLVGRRAYYNEFHDPLVLAVLRKLIDANLLVSDRHTTETTLSQPNTSPDNDGSATIELAHETLIQFWPQLEHWMEENRAIVKLRHHLSDDAHRWRSLCATAPNQADDELWHGSKLERVQELQRDHLFELSVGALSQNELDFIAASVELRDRQQQIKLTQERQRRKLAEAKLKVEKQRTRLSILVGCLAAVTIGTGLISYAMQKASTSFTAGTIQNRINALYDQYIQEEDGQMVTQVNNQQIETMLSSIRILQDLEDLGVEDASDLHRLGFDDLEILEKLQAVIFSIHEFNRIEAHQVGINSVDMSSDGEWVVTAGSDHALKVFSSHGQFQYEMNHDMETVWDTQVSHDNEIIASSSWDSHQSVVSLWSSRTGELLLPPLSVEGIQYFFGLSFSSDDQMLAASTRQDSIVLWDISSGEVIRVLEDPREDPNAQTRVPLFSLDFNAQYPNILAAIGGHIDHGMKIWDLNLSSNNTPYLLGNTEDQHDDIVYDVSFSPDGELLASASQDGTVRLWAWQQNVDQQLVAVIKPSNHEPLIQSVNFSPSEELLLLAIGMNNGRIEIVNVNTSMSWWQEHQTPYETPDYVLEGHQSMVNQVVFNPVDPNTIVSVGDDRTLRYWQLANRSDTRERASQNISTLTEYACSFLIDYFLAHPIEQEAICQVAQVEY